MEVILEGGMRLLLAADPLADDERRTHYRRVARIAKRRYELFKGR
jgi:hypothetical protein